MTRPVPPGHSDGIDRDPSSVTAAPVDAERANLARLASLGTALAGVAHELNNPLAAIIGFSQLLLSKEWNDEDRAAGFNRAENVRQTPR